MLFTETSGRFSPGRLVATRNLLEWVPKEEILRAYCRHLNCDWGNIPDSDKQHNNYALNHGGRLLSAYRSVGGIHFWIITEADRSSTTCLLPEEY